MSFSRSQKGGNKLFLDGFSTVLNEKWIKTCIEM